MNQDLTIHIKAKHKGNLGGCNITSCVRVRQILTDSIIRYLNENSLIWNNSKSKCFNFFIIPNQHIYRLYDDEIETDSGFYLTIFKVQSSIDRVV